MSEAIRDRSAKLYGVISWNYGQWSFRYAKCRFALTRNKRQALKLAKRENAQVRSVNMSTSPASWDSPTFLMCSESVADFRFTRFSGAD